MTNDLKIGISGLGVLHTDEKVPDIDTKFQMVKDSGVFDYIERTPSRADLPQFLAASAKHGVPLPSGGFFYMVGRDEALLKDNLLIAKECGSDVHNVQIFTKDAGGEILTDDDIADVVLRTTEFGMKHGVLPCFENHINMWSEHCGRVGRVAAKVKSRGMEYSMTMDHSHVIIKMDNPVELAVQDLHKDVASGAVILDPAKPGNVAKQWIDANCIVIAHARPAIPNNPTNIWAKHPDGSYGRGVQYPWLKPLPGEWHSEWDGSKLEPWKKTMRDLLQHHAAASSGSRLRYLTLEMIPPPDYGAGAKYSIFDNNVACAQWVRQTWNSIKAKA
jgi:hypothetical protein